MISRLIVFVSLFIFSCSSVLAQEVLCRRQSNLTGQSNLMHPFSAQSVAQSGEIIAELMRRRAAQTHRLNDPKIEATINIILRCGGAAGVEQSGHGDCWFESALAALARIPAGQEAIANMITQESNVYYLVTFPGSRDPVRVNSQDILQEKAIDAAPWARVLQTAAIKSWPNLATEGMTKYSPYNNEPSPIIGLKALTGHRINCIDVSKRPIEQIAQLLQTAFDQQMAITASTYSEQRLKQIAVVPAHAYTVLGYDRTRNVITLRNPWGFNLQPRNQTRFPQMPEIGQEMAGVYDIGGGVIQMTLPVFAEYYHFLCFAPL